MRMEALAVYGAAALSTAADLANVFDSSVPQSITLELDGRFLILAPLSEKLFLLLAGRRHG